MSSFSSVTGVLAVGLVAVWAGVGCGPTKLPDDARTTKDGTGGAAAGGAAGGSGGTGGSVAATGGAGPSGAGGQGGGNVVTNIDAGIGNSGGAGPGTGGQPGTGGAGQGGVGQGGVGQAGGAGGQGGGGGQAGQGGAGAGGAGGQGGAGPVDLGPPDTAAAISCAGSTFALCEDFETGTSINAGLWKIVAGKGTGTVTLDTTRAAGGSRQSVHVHVDPGADAAIGLNETKTFPALKGGFFARAFIYIPSTDKDLNFTGDRHTRLFYAEGAAPYGEYALGIWNGGIIQNHYSPTDDSQDSKKLPPFDQWFCLEYELDATAGRVAAYLDGVEMPELRHAGWPATNVVNLTIGVTRFGAFPKAEDIWFDNIAVSTTRIGCTR